MDKLYGSEVYLNKVVQKRKKRGGQWQEGDKSVWQPAGVLFWPRCWSHGLGFAYLNSSSSTWLLNVTFRNILLYFNQKCKSTFMVST